MNKHIILILAASLLTLAAGAQITVTGTVRSASDTTAMIGVHVNELGTTNATVTDIRGNYSITVRNQQSVVVVSALGYISQQIEVGARKVIGVVLAEESYQVDELVVIGYGTVRKSDLTGSVASMKSRDIENSTLMSINDIMTGRMAGVSIVSSGGEPGAGVSIRVRGASSINADTEPLYVIDGIPYEKNSTQTSAFGGVGGSSIDPMAALNPADIASIEVLKDASATAIYGSRGANGVVIITTKTGKEGATVVNYSASMGGSMRPANLISVLNAREYADYRYNIMKYGGVTPDGRYITPEGDPVDYSDTIGRNWQRELFRTSLEQNHNVSISGGNKQTRFLISAGYSGQEGIIRNSSYDRLNFRVNINQHITPKLSANATLTYTKTDQNGSVISSDQGMGAAAGLIQQMILFRPVNYGSIDEIDMEQSPPIANPLLYNQEYVKTNEGHRTQWAFNTTYRFNNDLNLRLSYNGFESMTRTKEYAPQTIGPGYQVHGKNTSAYGIQSKWLVEALLNYNKRFNTNARLDATLGYTIERLNTRTEGVTVQNLLDESLRRESIAYGIDVLLPITNNHSCVSLISYFGRANYTLRERYLFTATLRADGSSKFTEDNKFSFFPSGAFAWKLSEEPFMRSVSAISNLKLRLGYGVTGNQSISPYSTLNQMTVGHTLFDNSILGLGIYINRRGLEKLKWETTTQYNAAVEIGLFSNRLNLTVDAYEKYTTDLLLNQNISQVAGVDFIVNNIGAVRNRGVEVSLGAMVLRHRNFTWETNFNITFNRNRVTDLGTVDHFFVDPSNNSQLVNAFIVQKGKPVGSMYGYQYAGVYQYGDFVEFYDVDAAGNMTLKSLEECMAIYRPNLTYTRMPGVVDRAGANVAPGYAKYKDLDGNGIVNEYDRTIIGRSDPNFYGGWSNTFTIKNFDVNFFISYSYGNNLFNACNSAWGMATRNMNKITDVWYRGWKPNDPQNGYPYTTDIAGARDIASSMCVKDASYIRLKEISVGYRFPSKITSKWGISNLRFFVTAHNLLTITNYSYYDPEIAFRNPLASGWDRFNYPRPRTFMGGVSVNF